MAAEPTSIEVFALWQHIHKMKARIHSHEIMGKISYKPLGPLTVSYEGKEIFRIDQGGKWEFSSPAGATFRECCQWMMLNPDTLRFDYFAFDKGWKPWKKEN